MVLSKNKMAENKSLIYIIEYITLHTIIFSSITGVNCLSHPVFSMELTVQATTFLAFSQVLTVWATLFSMVLGPFRSDRPK